MPDPSARLLAPNRRSTKAGTMSDQTISYDNLLTEARGRVGLITLNRPKAMNALSPALMRELSDVLGRFEADSGIGATVITSSDKAFAAGADIKAMKEWGYMDVYLADYITAEWEAVLRIRMMDAVEAERSGLVSRVVPAGELLDEAIKTAQKICELSLPAVMMAKECVNRAFETTLSEGVRFERRLFHSLFATEDQKEGMAAFIDKRKPAFRNR